MAQSNQRRKYLTIATGICFLVVIVGFTPAIQERLGLLPAGGAPGAASGDALAPVLDEQDASRGAVVTTAGEVALPDADRIVQQTQLIRGELAARERAIAAQEDLVRRQVLAEFWKRQAAAAAATLGISLVIVLVMVRRAADWSGFSQRLREEESRMRNLQLSVIGALEEFESELAAARSWAAAEARSRRPAVDQSRSSEPLDRPLEVAGQGLFDARPAAPRESRSSAGFFFGEDEHVGEAVPMGTSRRRTEAEIERRAHSQPAASPAAVAFSAGAPAAMAGGPRPWQPTQEIPAGEPPSPAAAQAANGSDSWARRFLTSDAVDPQGRAASAGGPWAEPFRRTEPMPAPVVTPRYGAGGPSTREQVERLAADGYGETEIARRLGLSREEIHLALMLGRSARAEASAGPYPSDRIGGGSEIVPPAGWRPQRERAVAGPSGR